MQRAVIWLFLTGVLLALSSESVSGFGARGGVVRGGGVATPKGAAFGSASANVAVGPYGGGGVSHASKGTVVGPSGASATRSRAGGSFTTAGGTNVRYGGAGASTTGPLGGTQGRAVGGVQVTAPGGQQVTRVGGASRAVAPGGASVGRAGSITTGSGPFGSAAKVSGGTVARGPAGNGFGTSYRGGAAIGPNGVVAGGSRTGIAVGPGGVVAGGSRTGVAVRPGGVVTGGRSGTYHWGATTLPAYGGQVRTGFQNYSCFTPNWYSAHRAAWVTAGWAAGRAWSYPTYATVATYIPLPPEPIYYDYGTNVVYQDSSVYIGGEMVATAADYVTQAAQIADTGRDAAVAAVEDWQPLGVFAMVRGEETNSDKIFQLASNKAGVIRGNYYDAFTDTTLPVFGQVDLKTGRTAWSVGDRKTIVYEAGIANLTKDETPALVHFGADNTQQFVLVRIQQPEGQK